MKKVWARIGISVMVPNDFYADLKEKAKDGDVELDNFTAEFLMMRGHVEGESYIPQIVFEEEEV